MSEEEPLEIVRRAMEDRSVYEEMASKESEVWSNLLPNLETSDASAVDREASRELYVGRHQSTLVRQTRERDLKFSNGVTLGCGAGRLERELIDAGVCESFHGVDIAEGAIASAKAIAKEKDLPITYEVADLNYVELPTQAYDLAVTQTILHHVLHLEHLAEQIWKSLKPDGYLWIHDFVGESQGQHDQKRLDLMNQVLEILPEKFHHNKINGRIVNKIERPIPGKLGSPFECIRSAEIIPVFEKWFTIEWRIEFNAFMQRVIPPGTRAAFLENEDTHALFEVILMLDNLCIQEEAVKPTGGQYLMRPKKLLSVPGGIKKSIFRNPLKYFR